MSEYIDREDALSIALEGRSSEEIHHYLKRLPIIQIREGQWTEENDPTDAPFFQRKFRCSACNGWNTYGFTRYCPECGAKMMNATALTMKVNNDEIH